MRERERGTRDTGRERERGGSRDIERERGTRDIGRGRERGILET